MVNPFYLKHFPGKLNPGNLSLCNFFVNNPSLNSWKIFLMDISYCMKVEAMSSSFIESIQLMVCKNNIEENIRDFIIILY